jgi:hypothetical protein
VTARPSFKAAWTLFGEVYQAGQSDADALALVSAKIGGKVKYNIDDGTFANACPIRMSYVLNYSGVAMPASDPGEGKIKAVTGADHKWYLFRVRDMMKILATKFGAPDQEVKNPKSADFTGKRGIMAIVGHGWTDAIGHVSLWDGHYFSDKNHLSDSNVNGPFVPEVARMWNLPA